MCIYIICKESNTGIQCSLENVQFLYILKSPVKEPQIVFRIFEDIISGCTLTVLLAFWGVKLCLMSINFRVLQHVNSREMLDIG